MKTQILVASEKQYKVLGFVEEITACDCCGKTDLKGTYAMEDIESGDICYFGCICAAKKKGLTKKEFTTEAKAKLKGLIIAAQNEYRNSIEYNNYHNTIAEFHKIEHEWEAITDAIHNVFEPLRIVKEAKKAEISKKYLLKENMIY